MEIVSGKDVVLRLTQKELEYVDSCRKQKKGPKPSSASPKAKRDLRRTD